MVKEVKCVGGLAGHTDMTRHTQVWVWASQRTVAFHQLTLAICRLVCEFFKRVVNDFNTGWVLDLPWAEL